MGNIIKASTIAEFLNSELIGEDLEIRHVVSLDKLVSGGLAFVNNNKYLDDFQSRALLIVKKDRELNSASLNSYIKVENPRLSFAITVQRFFVPDKLALIAPSTRIGNEVSIGENVTIGEFCVIGDRVQIGNNTIINNNVIIYSDSVIGSNCYIKSGSVIGEDGFGFDFEEDGTPVRLPHLGRVVLDSNVEVGANCTVARGTLNDTYLGPFVKLDDQVHVAHNCRIGKNTIITAQAELSGNVVVGEGCWLGPNCSIIQKIRIGDNVTIGLGAIVTGDIDSNRSIMGLESLPLKALLKFKKRIEYQ